MDQAASPLVIPPYVPADRYAGVDVIVDLSRLNLASIRQTGDAVELGALVPLQDLVEAPWGNAPAAHILAQAAHLAAHPGLRRLATVGGVLSAHSGPPEVLLALLVLEARVVLRGPGDTVRELPLDNFLNQDPQLSGEVAAWLKFTRPSARAAGGLERVARTPRDEAIVAAAAVVEMEGEVCQRARLGLAGAGVTPRRIPRAEQLLEGQALSLERIGQAAEAAQAALQFASDLRASAAYRQAMAAVVARRALLRAWERSQA
jgi:carbon-monoxide dehydrogenase medium subunit